MSSVSHPVVTGAVRPDFPMAEWDRSPWNRWSFQHIGEILPTTPVRAGAAHVFETSLQDFSALAFDDHGQRSTIRDWLGTSFTDGFIVVHKNRIVFEDYLNSMGPKTLHLAQSVSKSIATSAFGVMVGRGVIDPARLITDYLPELNATAYRGATVQHALDMTSGVRFDETYTDPFSDAGRIDVASGWKQPLSEGVWPPTMWDLVLSLNTAVRPHGAAFEYRSIETDVVAMILERVTGKKLAAMVSEEIWQPIGAEADASFTTDPSGYAQADGGFNACLRDYARFGQLWANRGMVNGTRILPEAWVDATLTGDSSKFGAPYTEVLPKGAYSNQFWLKEGRGTVAMCRGVCGQLIYIDVARNFVAVKLSSWPDFTNPARVRTALAAIERIAEAVTAA